MGSISEAQFREMLARTERARFRGAASGDEESPELESQLHQDIHDYCRSKGWAVIHSRMDCKTTTAKGVPDFIISMPGRVAFVECKRKRNKPTPEQLAFLCHVRHHGHIAGVVYSMEEFIALTKEGI